MIYHLFFLEHIRSDCALGYVSFKEFVFQSGIELPFRENSRLLWSAFELLIGHDVFPKERRVAVLYPQLPIDLGAAEEQVMAGIPSTSWIPMWRRTVTPAP